MNIPNTGVGPPLPILTSPQDKAVVSLRRYKIDAATARLTLQRMVWYITAHFFGRKSKLQPFSLGRFNQ